MDRRPLDLSDDGIEVHQGFFAESELILINRELDEIFSSENFSGNSSISYFLKPNKKMKIIPSASLSIFSVNIPEKIINAYFLVASTSARKGADYIVTSAEIWQDENNQTPLFWHTDNRNGMIRCLVYLQGGDSRSGAFKYMLGTHKRTWHCHHELTKTQIDEMEHLIFIAESSAGSLVAADTFGFHGNCPKINRRRVLMIEFQPRHLIEYPRSNVYLKSRDLSSKVIEHIGIFRHQPVSMVHGADFYFFARSMPLERRFYRLAHSVYSVVQQSIELVSVAMRKVFR